MLKTATIAHLKMKYSQRIVGTKLRPLHVILCPRYKIEFTCTINIYIYICIV